MRSAWRYPVEISTLVLQVQASVVRVNVNWGMNLSPVCNKSTGECYCNVSTT